MRTVARQLIVVLVSVVVATGSVPSTQAFAKKDSKNAVCNGGSGSSPRAKTSIRQAATPSYSEHAALSDSGRFMAFDTSASDLLLDGDGNSITTIDTNGLNDVYVTDRVSGDTSIISYNFANLAAANGSSYDPAVSANGRYVVFDSNASNLVPGDTNGVTDVFLFDQMSSTITRLSRKGASGAAGNGSSVQPTISNDGRYVAFQSVATNLVSNDTNGAQDIFVRDLQAGTLTRVSTSASGGQGNASSYSGVISGNGGWVTFISGASNLVSGDTNSSGDIFLKNLGTGAIQRSNVKNNGAQSPSSLPIALDVSNSGRYVLLSSDAGLTGDSNGTDDVFIRDKSAGTTTRLSSGPSGSNGSSTLGQMSDDANIVAFQSRATNLLGSTDGNGTASDIFELNRSSGILNLLSKSSTDLWGNSDSFDPAVSGDGAFVGYQSYASNLVPEAGSGGLDIYFHEWVNGACQTSRETKPRQIDILLALLVGIAGMGLPGVGTTYDPNCTSETEAPNDPGQTQATDVVVDRFPNISDPIPGSGGFPITIPLRFGNLSFGERHIAARHGWGPISRGLADQTLHFGVVSQPPGADPTRFNYTLQYSGTNGVVCIATAAIELENKGWDADGYLGLLTFFAVAAS